MLASGSRARLRWQADEPAATDGDGEEHADLDPWDAGGHDRGRRLRGQARARGRLGGGAGRGSGLRGQARAGHRLGGGGIRRGDGTLSGRVGGAHRILLAS